MADETEIKAGDVVTLKSGSQPFAVAAVKQQDNNPGRRLALLVWDGGPAGPRHTEVAVDALVKG